MAVAGLEVSTRRPSMQATAQLMLEGQVRQKALAANVMRQALREAGWPDDDRAALKLWGFVPVSPDGSKAIWDKESRRMRNVRHGDWHNPATHAALDPKSPLGQFARSFDGLTVDFRFKADGAHVVLTFAQVK